MLVILFIGIIIFCYFYKEHFYPIKSKFPNVTDEIILDENKNCQTKKFNINDINLNDTLLNYMSLQI
jgi:hypothetical protein